MATCAELLTSSFPDLDEHVLYYIQGMLEDASEHFQVPNDVYETIGEFLHSVAGDERQNDILDACTRILNLLKKSDKTPNEGASNFKVLAAPVHLGKMVEELDICEESAGSILDVKRDAGGQVDQRRLEKAEARLKEKQDKRINQPPTSIVSVVHEGPSASQVISRRDKRMEAKGTNNCRDIRIENFDVAYGDRSLVCGADLLLVAGRRYGLVGRNGLGKTTLLRMISSGDLKIPQHISILHVEQEVVGDDTLALQSVLESDTRRESLIQEEKMISKAVMSGESDNPTLTTRLSEIYDELQAIEADKAPARASVILSGLGFDSFAQQRPTQTFSGGWRMRLALARALFSKPDLLLLDEPTNMLDMKAIIWLEAYLQSWSTTLLVVSHDRHFLDIVPTDVLHLHTQRIDAYRGNYSNFVKTMSEKLKNQQREYDSQQLLRAHLQVFINKNRHDKKLAGLVQSKIKMLERLPKVTLVVKEPEAVLRFPNTEKLLPPILQLDEVAFCYVPGNNIFNNVCVSADMESRICIVGENGAGKSTLLKILLGKLLPTKGLRNAHRNLRIGYFSQHHVDQLEMAISSVELLAQHFPGRPVEEYRRQLGSFGVSGDLATQQIDTLSGGQKSRVAFSFMCMHNPNFLILDEPTNHLDVESIEALGKAINKFTGGVILVSHDERLIRAVCRELWVCDSGQVQSLQGGFDEYRRLVEEELELQDKLK